MNPYRYILGTRVDYTTYGKAVSDLVSLALNGHPSGYVCVANVHVVMEAFDNPDFREVINSAYLVTPDGMPLVWGLRLLGIRGAERVYGPALTPAICNEASKNGIPVGFYGGTKAVLKRMIENLKLRFPELKVAYAYSPPFRRLTEEEDKRVIGEINSSGTKILFVGLGCPKQEWWMAGHLGKVNAVMIGVGAAFDFLAGVKPQAPPWMQGVGLEWFFRLITEPKRLWKRYLYHGPRFLFHFGRELVGHFLEKRK